MEIAIEFDGGEFRSLRRESGRLLARRVSTDYLVVRGDAARLRLLERQAEEFARCDEGLIVFGPGAIDLATLLELPLQSALEQGRLRHEDPVSRQFIGALVEGLLPAGSGQQHCRLIAPGSLDNSAGQRDLAFLQQLVRLRGYSPQVMSPGVALTLAESAHSGYSAIAVNMGAVAVDVSVVHQTRERLAFSIPRGSEHVERELARREERYLQLNDGREVLDDRPLRAWRAGVRSLREIADPRMLELRNLCRELVQQSLHQLQQELTPQLLKQLPSQLPLIVGGSLAMHQGVNELFVQGLRGTALPVKITEVLQAEQATFATLKGALVASAFADTQTFAPAA